MIDVEVEYGQRCGRILAERIGALHTSANQSQRLGQHAGIVAYQDRAGVPGVDLPNQIEHDTRIRLVELGLNFLDRLAWQYVLDI